MAGFSVESIVPSRMSMYPASPGKSQAKKLWLCRRNDCNIHHIMLSHTRTPSKYFIVDFISKTQLTNQAWQISWARPDRTLARHLSTSKELASVSSASCLSQIERQSQSNIEKAVRRGEVGEIQLTLTFSAKRWRTSSSYHYQDNSTYSFWELCKLNYTRVRYLQNWRTDRTASLELVAPFAQLLAG